MPPSALLRPTLGVSPQLWVQPLESASRFARGWMVISGSPPKPLNQARVPGISRPLECPFMLVNSASGPGVRNQAGVGLFSWLRHWGGLCQAEAFCLLPWERAACAFPVCPRQAALRLQGSQG